MLPAVWREISCVSYPCLHGYGRVFYTITILRDVSITFISFSRPTCPPYTGF